MTLLKIGAILHGSGVDLDVRRDQLRGYLAEREAAVAEEIRQAAANVNYRAKLSALAWAREKSWEEKLRDVESRQKQGLAPFAEVISTKLDMLKARSDVIQEVMAWYIAGVKLKQAQGRLVAECGNSSSYCR